MTDTGTAGSVAPGRIFLPVPRVRPLVALGQRLAFAVALALLVAATVYLDRGGYTDTVDGDVSALDAVYYATVTVTTTGYGDITPVTPQARLLTAVLVTPARVVFLILLVSTSVELLTERWRDASARSKWRSRLDDHYVICGYGVTGRSAARSLLGQGVERGRIVVVERDQRVLQAATDEGFAGVLGDAWRVEVLSQVQVERAQAVIVAPNRDDTAVLITLTARELSPTATIVAAAREHENAHLLEQSGADSVITSAEAAGRLLGLATRTPQVVTVVEDLLRAGEGLDLVERDVSDDELGRSRREIAGMLVVAVFRGGRLLAFDDPACESLQAGDRLVGFAARPGTGVG